MYIVKYHSNHVFFARVAMIQESGVIVVEGCEEFSDAFFLFFVGAFNFELCSVALFKNSADRVDYFFLSAGDKFLLVILYNNKSQAQTQ